MDHSINYFTLLSQAIWKCKNWKENHRHFQLWRERRKLVKKKIHSVLFSHTWRAPCKCTIPEEKKIIFPYSMQSVMQRQCESQSYMKGIWAENCLGKGLGNSELSFFFLPPHFLQICKLLCYQNAKEYFSFFYIHKITLSLALFIFPIQTLRPVLQRSLQLEKRKIVLSAKKMPHSDPSMMICTCRMEAWSNSFCPALPHYYFQSHHVFVFSLDTHTLLIWLMPNWTPQAEKQASKKMFTSQPVHKDRYLFEFLGCWAQLN